ncbi:LacI family transcriptional regulator [Streptomyces sp. 8K308]|uniref:LacI family DNA-binding transcriptional regulator n=1 Tax=Streptomyces sp. 8K308 TaxID=2530388 RepID=UPI00104F2351|nr:LacI family DNA-binding transcriptional regulator [Streptomyces sp. 8K308]TDC27176.1 LacI family transcriptional regulator [Streptomyces sp. 8K308]
MPTIHDVAREAGVSASTVSRALSGSRKVRPELVRRVSEAAEALGYRHNAVARALRTNRSDTIGMVVPQISNPYFPLLVEAVERRLQRSDIELLLCDSNRDVAVEARRLQALVDRQVDGIIISPLDAVASARAVRSTGERVPLIQVDRRVEGAVSDWVGADDDAGISQLVDLLVARGRRGLVLVSSAFTNSSAVARAQAFEAALARHGLSPARSPLLGSFEVAWGLEAARRLTRREAGAAEVDGVVCGNDVIALGMLRGLRLAGVRVPDDMAVTGFDDIAFAEISDPPLTTVRQPWEAMADECVRLLLRADPVPGPRGIAVAPVLRIRESTPVERSEP